MDKDRSGEPQFSEDSRGEKSDHDKRIAEKANLIVAQLDAEISIGRHDRKTYVGYTESVKLDGAQDALDTLTVARDYFRGQEMQAFVGLGIADTDGENDKQYNYSLTIYL